MFNGVVTAVRFVLPLFLIGVLLDSDAYVGLGVVSLFVGFVLFDYDYDALGVLGLMLFTCLNGLCFLCLGFWLADVVGCYGFCCVNSVVDACSFVYCTDVC